MNHTRGYEATGTAARRISDEDRQRVVVRLKEAAGEGALGLDELEDRIAAVYEAKTVFDLEPITADLPVVPDAKPAAKVRHRRPLVMEDDEFRGHFTTYCLVIGMLVLIWLTSGGDHPWPIYPAAGWGIGLGSHYQVAARHQRKRLARARSLGISLQDLEVREAEERRARREARKRKRERAIGEARRLTGPHVQQARRQAQQAMQQAEQALRQAGLGCATPSPPAPPSGPAPTHAEGAPAATEPVSPTRSYVAAMFVDVVGSTGLNEALGDDGWVRVRDRLRELLRECFEREGGCEVNNAGDGVLARFDHPTRAACAAIEILRRLEHQRSETGFAPSVRIGIHSGDVVDAGDDLIGSVVNLASRVTAAGEPDQITITEHVADHLDPSIRTEDRGIHTLRGVGRPRHLLSIDWQ